MGNNTILILAVLLVAVSVPVLALTRMVEVSEPTFAVEVSAPAEMFAADTDTVSVKVTNSGTEGFFTISQVLAATPANMWASVNEPKAVRIQMGGEVTFTITLSPAVDARPGTYSFSFTVAEQNTGLRADGQWSTSVRQRVAAALIREFDTDCKQCTGNAGFTASVENIGTAPLTAVKLIARLGEQEQVLTIGDMLIGGKKQLSGSFDLGTLGPGEYAIRSELVDETHSFDARAAAFSIPVRKDIATDRAESFTPWSRDIKLTATNRGNAEDTALIRATVSETFFASISYSAEPTRRDGQDVIWEAALEPGESVAVGYTEFFWPIPVVIVAVIIVALYSYLWTTALILTKTVTRREGEWAVSLRIRNRGVAVDGVVVRDFIPSGFSVGGSFETLKPITRKMETGTEMVWRVGGMRKGEDRILHYRLRGDRGGALPAAHLRAKRGEKTILVSSDKARIFGSGAAPKLKVEVED